jgi:anti-sigma-K factor RskA
MTDEPSIPDVPDLTAAEHALRLLTGEERREADAREAADPEFAAEVARWRGRLAPLDEEIAAVAPPTGLWRRIAGATGGTAANDNVVTLRRSVTMWRLATGGMTAIAAGLSLVVLFPPRTVVAPPTKQQAAAAPMVAMLADERATRVVASWDPNSRQLVLALAGPMPAAGAHSHELWVIPPGGKPRSLGTMSADSAMHMRLANAIAGLLEQGATIAISVEPPGGSPTGAPTGPVVASGALRAA